MSAKETRVKILVFALIYRAHFHAFASLATQVKMHIEKYVS